MLRRACRSARLNNGVRVERPKVAMGLVAALAANLGLATLTLISVALTIYLLYVMIHPEKF